jgi:hypothetical protein
MQGDLSAITHAEVFPMIEERFTAIQDAFLRRIVVAQ